MPDTFTVKPAEGRRVRDPSTGRPLPRDAWSRVARSSYYVKRIAAGDVVVRSESEPKETATRRGSKSAAADAAQPAPKEA